MAIQDLMPWSSSRDVTGGRGGETDPLSALYREMNRLFDDFSRGFGLAPFGQDRSARSGRLRIRSLKPSGLLGCMA
jgi:hypothetical protein